MKKTAMYLYDQKLKLSKLIESLIILFQLIMHPTNIVVSDANIMEFKRAPCQLNKIIQFIQKRNSNWHSTDS